MLKGQVVLLRDTAGLWRELAPYKQRPGSQEASLGLELGYKRSKSQEKLHLVLKNSLQIKQITYFSSGVR